MALVLLRLPLALLLPWRAYVALGQLLTYASRLVPLTWHLALAWNAVELDTQSCWYLKSLHPWLDFFQYFTVPEPAATLEALVGLANFGGLATLSCFYGRRYPHLGITPLVLLPTQALVLTACVGLSLSARRRPTRRRAALQGKACADADTSFGGPAPLTAAADGNHDTALAARLSRAAAAWLLQRRQGLRFRGATFTRSRPAAAAAAVHCGDGGGGAIAGGSAAGAGAAPPPSAHMPSGQDHQTESLPPAPYTYHPFDRDSAPTIYAGVTIPPAADDNAITTAATHTLVVRQRAHRYQPYIQRHSLFAKLAGYDPTQISPGYEARLALLGNADGRRRLAGVYVRAGCIELLLEEEEWGPQWGSGNTSAEAGEWADGPVPRISAGGGGGGGVDCVLGVLAGGAGALACSGVLVASGAGGGASGVGSAKRVSVEWGGEGEGEGAAAAVPSGGSEAAGIGAAASGSRLSLDAILQALQLRHLDGSSVTDDATSDTETEAPAEADERLRPLTSGTEFPQRDGDAAGASSIAATDGNGVGMDGAAPELQDSEQHLWGGAWRGVPAVGIARAEAAPAPGTPQAHTAADRAVGVATRRVAAGTALLPLPPPPPPSFTLSVQPRVLLLPQPANPAAPQPPVASASPPTEDTRAEPPPAVVASLHILIALHPVQPAPNTTGRRTVPPPALHSSITPGSSTTSTLGITNTTSTLGITLGSSLDTTPTSTLGSTLSSAPTITLGSILGSTLGSTAGRGASIPSQVEILLRCRGAYLRTRVRWLPVPANVHPHGSGAGGDHGMASGGGGVSMAGGARQAPAGTADQGEGQGEEGAEREGRDLSDQDERSRVAAAVVELLEAPPQPGVLMLDLRWGGAPCRAVPLLLTTDPRVASELRAASAAWPRSPAELSELLFDMGVWEAHAGSLGTDVAAAAPAAAPTPFTCPPPLLPALGQHLLHYAAACGWACTLERLRRELWLLFQSRSRASAAATTAATTATGTVNPASVAAGAAAVAQAASPLPAATAGAERTVAGGPLARADNAVAAAEVVAAAADSTEPGVTEMGRPEFSAAALAVAEDASAAAQPAVATMALQQPAAKPVALADGSNGGLRCRRSSHDVTATSGSDGADTGAGATPVVEEARSREWRALAGPHVDGGGAGAGGGTGDWVRALLLALGLRRAPAAEEEAFHVYAQSRTLAQGLAIRLTDCFGLAAAAYHCALAGRLLSPAALALLLVYGTGALSTLAGLLLPPHRWAALEAACVLPRYAGYAAGKALIVLGGVQVPPGAARYLRTPVLLVMQGLVLPASGLLPFKTALLILPALNTLTALELMAAHTPARLAAWSGVWTALLGLTANLVCHVYVRLCFERRRRQGVGGGAAAAAAAGAMGDGGESGAVRGVGEGAVWEAGSSTGTSAKDGKTN